MKISDYIKASQHEPDAPVPLEVHLEKFPHTEIPVSKIDENGYRQDTFERDTDPNKLMRVDYRTYSPEYLARLGNPSISAAGVSALETLDKINNLPKTDE